MSKTDLIAICIALAVGAYVVNMQMKVSETMSAAVSTAMEAHVTPGFDEPVEAPKADSAHPPLPPSDFKIVDGRGRTVKRRNAEALLRPYDLTSSRTATLMSFVDPQSLLREGEEMPTGELRGLMVEARSAFIADRACEAMLNTVAAHCGVKSYKTAYIGELNCERCDAADRLRRKPFVGHYQIFTEMAFTPKADVGVFPDTSEVLFTEKTFELDEFQLTGPDSAAVEDRFAYIVKAATRACEDIKALHGNCVVSDIKLSKRVYKQSSDFSDIPSSFSLAYFSPLGNG